MSGKDAYDGDRVVYRDGGEGEGKVEGIHGANHTMTGTRMSTSRGFFPLCRLT